MRVGEISTFSPQLAVAATEDRVVVSAESARSDHIDSVRIQNLPINRRDYLGLALLTPGVVNTNHIANAIDRRIAPTPSSGLGNGRGNTFMIDGLDNLYNSGSVRSSISQNAILDIAHDDIHLVLHALPQVVCELLQLALSQCFDLLPILLGPLLEPRL